MATIGRVSWPSDCSAGVIRTRMSAAAPTTVTPQRDEDQGKEDRRPWFAAGKRMLKAFRCHCPKQRKEARQDNGAAEQVHAELHSVRQTERRFSLLPGRCQGEQFKRKRKRKRNDEAEGCGSYQNEPPVLVRAYLEQNESFRCRQDLNPQHGPTPVGGQYPWWWDRSCMNILQRAGLQQAGLYPKTRRTMRDLICGGKAYNKRGTRSPRSLIVLYITLMQRGK